MFGRLLIQVRYCKAERVGGRPASATIIYIVARYVKDKLLETGPIYIVCGSKTGSRNLKFAQGPTGRHNVARCGSSGCRE